MTYTISNHFHPLQQIPEKREAETAVGWQQKEMQ